MAASYTLQGQHRTVLVRSPSLTEDAMELTALSHPSGIGFVRVIAYQTWLSGGVHTALMPIVDHIEQIVTHHHVVGGAPVQKVDASGLLTNWVEFTVAATAPAAGVEPTMTAVVRIPVQALHDESDFTHYFAPVEHALTAAAGG